MNRDRQGRPEMTFRDVCLAVFRHRKKAAAAFLLVMTATVLITLMMPKAYLSESKLFVRLGRENAMLDPAATLGEKSVVAVPLSREAEINSVATMLASRAVVEQAVDKIGPELILEGPPSAPSTETGSRLREGLAKALESLKGLVSSSELPPRERAVEQLTKDLGIEPVRNTNVVLVSYEASQPELAQKVVASVVDTYLDQHVRLNRTSGAYEFFSEHTKRLRDELERLEEQLRDLKTSTGLASVGQRREQIVTRIGRLEDDLLGVEAARSETQAKVDALRAKLAALPKEQIVETNTGIGNTGTDLIRERFFALQVQEKEAATIYTEEHPKLKAIREQLAEAERILTQQEPTRTEVTTSPDTTYEQTRLALVAEEPALESLVAKCATLQSQLTTERASLATLNANETRIAQLQRETELREAEYRKYATNLEEARIDQAMETQRMSNISVVQPASLQPRAVRPRKAMNLALGFLVAACAAFGVALLAEFTRPPEPRDKEKEDHAPRPKLATVSRLSPGSFTAVRKT